MKSRTYSVTIEGVTPLLMHQDDVSWSTQIKKWQKDPANKKESVAGDDRSPAWIWIGYMYQAAGKIVLPSDNIMTVLREGGGMVPTGNAKGDKSFKRMSQSGIVCNEIAWPILINDKTIETKEINALIGNKDFETHEDLASKLGFNLFVKRAKVGMAKTIRVRPRFDVWKASGTVTVFEEQITTKVLTDILQYAGTYAGICDWRPSSKQSPGSFGKFIPTKIQEVK